MDRETHKHLIGPTFENGQAMYAGIGRETPIGFPGCDGLIVRRPQGASGVEVHCMALADTRGQGNPWTYFTIDDWTRLITTHWPAICEGAWGILAGICTKGGTVYHERVTPGMLRMVLGHLPDRPSALASRR